MNVRLFLLTSCMVTLPACSLLLDRRADQCAIDDDCVRFAGTRCDQKLRLCVVIDDTPDSSRPPADSGATGDDAPLDAVPDVAIDVDRCLGPAGCYACLPSNDLQFGSACTDAECKPFDNRTRLKKLSPDGGLLPLPERDAGRE